MNRKVTTRMALIAVLLCAAASVFLCSERAYAASAKVVLTSEPQKVKVGDTFHVVCTVSSSEKFLDVRMKLLYDAGMFEFVQGGSKVSGGNGELVISSVGNEESVKKRTFSLEFKALKKGGGGFDLDKQVEIVNEDGESFSVSSDLVGVSVSEAEGEGSPEEGQEEQPQATAAPSTNNKLKMLSFNGISMKPEFDADVLDYTVTVDFDTNILYFNYTPENGQARVRIRNNDQLVPGENTVKVTVTAESGDKRVYKIRVIKETEDETKVREQSEKGASDITFSVYEKKGAIYIQNQYQFQVADVAEEDIIPSGYVKTSVELDGKSVPAYTMENDLDNNYLLMYLKGISGEPTLYQYDRAEKTLQRYTGTMTQKVNKGGNVAYEVEVTPNAWLYAVIIGLMVLVLVLLIVILNMLLRKKFGRGRRELNDLDF
ncbi:MAG: hypothetical protein HFG32_00570 [Eubacterium sp.]|nr:hypothetical protein [Eubacterium sp.]